MTGLIRAKKSLGQNFLRDGQVARRIIDAVCPLQTDVIIEIGPGTGALTRMLVENSGRVVAVEIDARLVNELRRSINSENLSIVEADALKLDWADLIQMSEALLASARSDSPEERRVRVVANLPYYIATPTIERLLVFGRRIFDLTLMLQNEVADRIATGPGTKAYGVLSVLVQYYCVPTKLFEVPPSAFNPAPKVRSAIIRLVMREFPAVDVSDEARFFALVRAAFAQRRKTITNNLRAAEPTLGFHQPVEAALEAALVAPGRRAETLSIEEFAGLYKRLYR